MTTMATQVGIRELRDNLTALLRRVREGETVEVTHHGTPVAIISPADDDPIARLVARGEAKPPIPLDRPIVPVELPPGSKAASEILQEDRDSER